MDGGNDVEDAEGKVMMTMKEIRATLDEMERLIPALDERDVMYNISQFMVLVTKLLRDAYALI